MFLVFALYQKQLYIFYDYDVLLGRENVSGWTDIQTY
jgi:hypothetical protein